MTTDHPISTTYLDEQVARVSLILPAAGAWDPTPLELLCAGFQHVALFVTYTSGGQAIGGVELKLEYTHDGVENAAALWYQDTAFTQPVVVTGADTVSDVQREGTEYGSVLANVAEYYVIEYDIPANAEQIRVSARETVQAGAPGVCEVIARFKVYA